VVTVMALSALELWLFWRLGERKRTREPRRQ
jgi:hypothetical protein